MLRGGSRGWGIRGRDADILRDGFSVRHDGNMDIGSLERGARREGCV